MKGCARRFTVNGDGVLSSSRLSQDFVFVAPNRAMYDPNRGGVRHGALGETK